MVSNHKEFQKSDFGRDLLPEVLDWIRNNLAPDEVFDPDDLEEWAEERRPAQVCSVCLGEMGEQ